MARIRTTSLREFQRAVLERLRDLSSRKTVASKLGFQVGKDNWFVTLSDVSEVIPIPGFMVVPQTVSWFRGVSNVRGKLYSVTDFAAFQGHEPIGIGSERRVILISERLIGGSALLVNRMLGLRNPEVFTLDGGTHASLPWQKARYLDPYGTPWYELDLTALVEDIRFLEVGRPRVGAFQ